MLYLVLYSIGKKRISLIATTTTITTIAAAASSASSSFSSCKRRRKISLCIAANGLSWQKQTKTLFSFHSFILLPVQICLFVRSFATCSYISYSFSFSSVFFSLRFPYFIAFNAYSYTTTQTQCVYIICILYTSSSREHCWWYEIFFLSDRLKSKNTSIPFRWRNNENQTYAY